MQRGEYFALAALPRILWVTALVLLVTIIMVCQGGFVADPVHHPEQILNFHYFFMTLAWPVCMTEAILTYRIPIVQFENRKAYKYLHAVFQSLVGAFILIALVFMGEFKRYSGEMNFWSVHSWVGVTGIALYLAQYALGLYVYLISAWQPASRAAFYKYHRYLGSACFLVGLTAAIVGLAEVQVFDQGYTAGFASFNSPVVYNPLVMLLSGMAACFLFLGLTVMFGFVVLDQLGHPATTERARTTNGVAAKV